MVLLLYGFRPKYLRLTLFSELLEQIVAELLLTTVFVGRESENGARKTATVGLSPSEDLLFDHLEQTFGVD